MAGNAASWAIGVLTLLSFLELGQAAVDERAEPLLPAAAYRQAAAELEALYRDHANEDALLKARESRDRRLRALVNFYKPQRVEGLSDQDLLALVSSCEAVAEFRQGLEWSGLLLKRRPDSEPAMYACFRCLLNEGELQQAEALTARAVKDQPLASERRSMYGMLAERHRTLGNHALAADYAHSWVTFVLHKTPGKPALIDSLSRYFARLDESESRSVRLTERWRQHRQFVQAQLDRLDAQGSAAVDPTSKVRSVSLHRLLWQIDRRVDDQTADGTLKRWTEAVIAASSGRVSGSELSREFGQLLATLEDRVVLHRNRTWVPLFASRAASELTRASSTTLVAPIKSRLEALGQSARECSRDGQSP